MKTVTIQPITDEASYQAALHRIEAIFDAAPNTPLGDELDVMAKLVEAYEAEQYPMDVPDAVSAIEFIMDQKGYTLGDLRKLIGASRASDLMNHKRPITIKQAKTLYQQWHVPAEALLAD